MLIKSMEGAFKKTFIKKFTLVNNLFLTQFLFNIDFQTSRLIWMRIQQHREPEGNSSKIYFLLQTMSQKEIYKGLRIGSLQGDRC